MKNTIIITLLILIHHVSFAQTSTSQFTSEVSYHIHSISLPDSGILLYGWTQSVISAKLYTKNNDLINQYKINIKNSIDRVGNGQPKFTVSLSRSGKSFYVVNGTNSGIVFNEFQLHPGNNKPVKSTYFPLQNARKYTFRISNYKLWVFGDLVIDILKNQTGYFYTLDLENPGDLQTFSTNNLMDITAKSLSYIQDICEVNDSLTARMINVKLEGKHSTIIQIITRNQTVVKKNIIQTENPNWYRPASQFSVKTTDGNSFITTVIYADNQLFKYADLVISRYDDGKISVIHELLADDVEKSLYSSIKPADYSVDISIINMMLMITDMVISDQYSSVAIQFYTPVSNYNSIADIHCTLVIVFNHNAGKFSKYVLPSYTQIYEQFYEPCAHLSLLPDNSFNVFIRMKNSVHMYNLNSALSKDLTYMEYNGTGNEIAMFHTDNENGSDGVITRLYIAEFPMKNSKTYTITRILLN